MMKTRMMKNEMMKKDMMMMMMDMTMKDMKMTRDEKKRWALRRTTAEDALQGRQWV